MLPRTVLEEGFVLQGERVTLIGPQGIWKPAATPELPLSIATTPHGPYMDSFSYDDLLLYSYRGDDPDLWINRALRTCISSQVPLVYFRAIVRGRYLAVWPVYVVGDDPGNLRFHVSLDQAEFSNTSGVLEGVEVERRYIITQFRQRLHQRTFRERVLDAY